jgi:hypothetical protein
MGAAEAALQEILALAGRPFQICGIDRHFRLIAVLGDRHISKLALALRAAKGIP